MVGGLDDLRRDLDERLEQLGLDSLRRLAEHAREAVSRRLERLRVDEHELFLDPERPRRGRAEAAQVHGLLAADAVYRPPRRLPRVVRGAGAEIGLVGDDPRIAADLLRALRVA